MRHLVLRMASGLAAALVAVAVAAGAQHPAPPQERGGGAGAGEKADVIADADVGAGADAGASAGAELRAVPRAGADTDWPDFRGPRGDGWAPAGAAVPLRWSETENVVWKTAIPGQGWSSPIVQDGRVWLTTATDDGRRRWVVAVSAATGEVLHERVVFEVAKPQSKNAMNSHASPSAVAEPGRVYVHFGSDGTACLDAESSATLWERRDLNCNHYEGAGSSPFLHGNLLVIHVDGGDVQYVVALDKRTGETVWKTPRSADYSDLPPPSRKAFSTPISIDVAGKLQLVSTGAEATMGYDPDTGAELWKVRARGFSMASRPVAGDGMVFVTTGFLQPQLLAVRTGGDGDITDTHALWAHRKNVPTMPSPILVGARLYMVSDRGTATCLDAATGEPLWRHRFEGAYCASPVYAAGRLYFFDRGGRTVVVAPEAEYRELARNELDAGFMASPAVVGNAFIVRTTKHLYRIEAPEAESGGGEAPKAESGGGEAPPKSESGGGEAPPKSESGGGEAPLKAESGGGEAPPKSESGGGQTKAR